MMLLVLFLAVCGGAFYLVRRFQSVDQQLQKERLQREASMIAAAMAWKNSKSSQ